MAQTAEKMTADNLKFTYEDYLLLPDDGKRYEIIEGDLFMTPSPDMRHQNILRELGKRIDKFIESKKLGIVFYSPCDVVFSKTNVVQPDIAFVSKENRTILTQKNIQGAPDLVVEITSPNSQERDLVLKKKLYAKYGVKEYWIVLSREEKVVVWSLDDQGYRLTSTYAKTDVLKNPL